MERISAVSVDNFLTNWNGLFPDAPLTMADLKKPQAVMGALFRLFDRLGVSRDAVLMTPEDSDEHLVYYRDLLPVINTIRIINYVFFSKASIAPEANMSITIMHMLQPTAMSSYSVLMLLFNLMVFNESRLEDIAPFEEELFAYKDKLKSLIEKKDNLIQMRNMEAVEKGNRAERLEKLEHDIPQLEEELKHEKEVEAEILQELEAITEENRQTEFLLEQKKAHRDGILAENARKKDLKVFDAEDVRQQAAQAALDVREAEAALSALSAALAQKESCLHNLQALKPAMDQANSLLRDIERLALAVKELEGGDLESEGAEGELVVLETERGELRAALGEAREAAAAAAARRRQRADERARRRADADNALREAEESFKRSTEEAERAASAARGIMEASARHAHERAAAEAELQALRARVAGGLTSMQESLLNKLKDVGRRVEAQNQRRRKL